MPRRSARSGYLYSAGLLQSPLYTRTCQDAFNLLERLTIAALARPGSVRQIPALAQETGLAVPTVAQLIGLLRQAGLVAERSPSGGISLARPPEDISLLDVVRATEGAGLLGRCVMGLAECSDEAPCPVHPFWKKTREALEEHLASQSIADLAEALSRRRRLGSKRPPTRS